MRLKWGTVSCAFAGISLVWMLFILVLAPRLKIELGENSSSSNLDLVLPIAAPLSALGLLCALGDLMYRNTLDLKGSIGIAANMLVLISLSLLWHSTFPSLPK